jgi:hypothetical protein
VAPTTSTTAGPTAGPAPPDAIPGTYTIGSANATGSDCTSTSSPSIVGQQFGVDVSGTTLTLNAGGQSANVPFNPANDTFSLSQADSGSLGFGTSTINGAFTATPSGVALNMQINIFGNCTVAVASTRTGNATQTPATSAPTTAAPTTETPTTAPTSQAPIAITNLGTVSASSTTPGFPASNAVDGDPSTSWFSTGSADGPTSTFTWTLPSDRHITTIAVTGNEQNSNSSFQSGFGYAQTEVQVIDSGGNVTFDQTTNGPSDSTHDFVVNANATGSTVKLILMNRESSACGGFSELVVDAFPS